MELREGDWCYDNDSARPECFWKLGRKFSRTGPGCVEHGRINFDVAFMLDDGKSLSFRHWGDSSEFESKLRPVTNADDLLRCKISDKHEEYVKAKANVDALKAQLDAMVLTKTLMEGKS